MVADEVLLELIHSELVSYAYTKAEEKEKDKKEVDFSSLEYAGFLSGYRMIERLTKDWPRFKDELETLKFICTDFWSAVYKKQIDNLRTNHQGVYVLQDNAFRFLNKISSGTQYLEHAPRVRV
uniref:Trafficking protein particle complex subunit 6B n=1 Tax=Graphocephala atropunctata TaxID=36148 RepID=A0A1B6MFA9_9HEMI